MARQPPQIPFALRATRAALRRINTFLSRRYEAERARRDPLATTSPDARFREAGQALNLVQPEDPAARAYREKHRTRLAQTLALIPPAGGARRALELGCYMQLTPLLAPFGGYTEVRGASLGPAGTTEVKTVRAGDRDFECTLDLFDAEADRFPYPDSHFSLVLVCELIEHLIRDPMHLLLECRRVLEEGGRLLITTPNVASLTSVARTLHGYDNPQIFYQYTRPVPGEPTRIPHVREYTPYELRAALRAAGFEMELLFTEPVAEFAKHLPMLSFLEEQGYNTAHRGEQIYSLARKRSGLPVDRYPLSLYTRE